MAWSWIPSDRQRDQPVMVTIRSRGTKIPKTIIFELHCACGEMLKGFHDYLAFRRRAGELGWKVTKDGEEICPKCKK